MIASVRFLFRSGHGAICQAKRFRTRSHTCNSLEAAIVTPMPWLLFAKMIFLLGETWAQIRYHLQQLLQKVPSKKLSIPVFNMRLRYWTRVKEPRLKIDKNLNIIKNKKLRNNKKYNRKTSDTFLICLWIFF